MNKELIIKLKADVDEWVYILHKNKFKSVRILSIIITHMVKDDAIEYIVDNTDEGRMRLSEGEFFLSKEEYIEYVNNNF